ncbi:MAG: quinone-dependent dihydroorotate dehydrogenase [Parvibaculaceae bacterium]
MDKAYDLLKPAFWRLDPERAHGLAVGALASGLWRSGRPRPHPSLKLRVAGIDFPNPVGLAAGFDKNGEAIDGTLGLGFGFVEVGSVTPRPQAGNPKPRLFRLTEDRAVVNRMGFNNEGHAAVLKRIEARRSRGGIVGVNLGANKESEDRIGDYVAGLKTFHGVASYLVVNVSSPNTPGLRNLQGRAELERLIGRLNKARESLLPSPPLFLKLAPDLADEELAEAGEAALQGGIDAVILSNTTVTRPALRSPAANEAGGLSGRPLFALSTEKLATFRRATQGRLPLIGVGGIDSAETAWKKIEAGASLVQLYSGLVYEGPGLVRRIVEGLDAEVRRRGLTNVAQAVGSRGTT